MLTESLNDRLKWFHANLYEVGQNQFILEENHQEGYTRILCRTNHRCLIFQIEGHGLTCLENGSCADHIIFEKASDQSWHLHIIECKRTVRVSDWKKIKKQFEGALLNALAIMGVLGIENIEKINCYTAFRVDKLTELESPYPALLKTQVGVRVSENPIIEWKNGRVQILSLKNVTHHKIQLDQVTGYGELML